LKPQNIRKDIVEIGNSLSIAGTVRRKAGNAAFASSF